MDFKGIYIVTCQAHRVIVKKANQMCGSFLLWTDQRIPGPVPNAFWGLLGPQKDVMVNFTKTVSKQTAIF